MAFPVGTIFSDDQFQQEVWLAGRRRDLDTQRLGEDEQSLEYRYGYTNKANPYSQTALMDRRQGQDLTQQRNASAARGQLRSGARLKQQANLLFDQGAAKDSLRSGYDDSKRALQRGREDVLSDFNTSSYQASLGARDRALAAQPLTPPEATEPPTGLPAGQQAPAGVETRQQKVMRILRGGPYANGEYTAATITRLRAEARAKGWI